MTSETDTEITAVYFDVTIYKDDSPWYDFPWHWYVKRGFSTYESGSAFSKWGALIASRRTCRRLAKAEFKRLNPQERRSFNYKYVAEVDR
jgi:hypothetical protein